MRPLLCVLMAGCAADPELPEVALYAPATSYCERTADAFCAFYLRCGWMAVASPDACRERFLETCNGRYEPLYVALESAGLLRLTNAGLTACATHLESVACAEQAGDLSGPCGTMWEGQQIEGGACGMGAAGIENLVCTPGTRCVLDLSFCGTCEAAAPIGAACVVDSDCDAAAVCVDELCVARAALGASCAEVACVREARCEQDVCVRRHEKGSPGATCASVLDCQYALACVNQECVAAAGLGETCSASTPCDGGYCSGVCEPLVPPGVTCTDDAECASGGCDDVCAPVPGACFS